jgi:hypothetical protein
MTASNSLFDYEPDLAHYKYAPSSSSRWIPCPGSAGAQSQGGDAAALGTLAHGVGEAKLSGKPLAPEHVEAFNALSVDDDLEMTAAINLFVDYVRGLPVLADGGELFTERRIGSKIILEHGGTIDVLGVNSRVIHVVDLKYGTYFVPIWDNHQIQCYINLAREIFPGRTQFFGTIVQPRVEGGRVATLEFSQQQLDEFQLKTMDATASTELHAGDHCKWCPLLLNCDVAYQHARAMAAEEFESIAVPPSAVDVARMKTLIGFADVVAELEKLARGKLLEHILAGNKVEGYKAAQSVGHRAWVDQQSVFALADLCGVPYSMICEKPELKSPAQVEKILPKKELVPYWHKPLRGITLAEESSNLDEYKPGSEFDVVQ